MSTSGYDPEKVRRQLEQERRARLRRFGLGFVGGTGLALLVLLPIASQFSYGRYTFTGHPTADAVGMAIAAGLALGLALVARNI